MSTAPVEVGPEAWTDEQIARNIAHVASEVVRALHINVNDLADQIDMKRSTLYTRLNGSSRFSAAELYRLASALGMSMDAFYRPVELLRAELAARVQNWKILQGDRPALTLVPDLPAVQLPLWSGSSSNPRARNLQLVSQ